MQEAEIIVAGEALIDVIVAPGGALSAIPGGGPYNVARTIGRLGGRSAFLGCLSTDRFGTLLRTGLEDAGVRMGLVVATDAPTTLAVAELDGSGAATYRFYLQGTSAPGLTPSEVPSPLPAEVSAIHVGTLGLVLEPMASTLATVAQAAATDVLVMLDPNCRPSVITNRERYLERLRRVLRRADVVKVSGDDLAFLSPGTAADAAARDLLRRGPRAVLLTDGSGAVKVFTVSSEITVPVPNVEVVDTVGAGDAFGGAFLRWWVGHGLGRSDLDDVSALRSAVEAAIEIASLTCQRAGAEPPSLREVKPAQRAAWSDQ